MKKILILTVLILAWPSQAELYKAKFGLSNLTINGNSSVHKWKVETKVIGGFLNVDSAALGKTGTTQASGTVIVPVRQLKSGKKRMDEVMHAAMNEPKHKLIKFTITGLEVKSVKDGVSTCAGSGAIEIKPGKSSGLIAKGRLNHNPTNISEILIPVHRSIPCCHLVVLSSSLEDSRTRIAPCLLSFSSVMTGE